MKVLTVRQPFAAWIVAGRKRVEYRSRQTYHRGPVLIHAGLAPLELTVDADGTPVPTNLPRGAIVGMVDIVDCEGEGDDWEWFLDNARALPVPIPCKGQLGLWTPPAAVLEALPASWLEAAARDVRPARSPRQPRPKDVPQGEADCDHCGAANVLPIGAPECLCCECERPFPVEWDADLLPARPR